MFKSRHRRGTEAIWIFGAIVISVHNALEQTLGWKKYLFAETNTAKSRQECVFDFDKMKIFGWGLFF